MLESLFVALKMEDVVLEELVEPTSCAMSLFTISFSSCVNELAAVVSWPFDILLARASPWPFLLEGAGGAGRGFEEQDWPVDEY